MLPEITNSVLLVLIVDAGAYAYYLMLMSIGSLIVWRIR
jgi:hypothetical protein